MLWIMLPVAACSKGEAKNANEPDANASTILTSEQEERAKTMANSWQAAVIYTVPYDVLNPNRSAQSSVNALFDPSDDYWGLPRSEGYELVDANCTGCHSVQIVMQQQATEARWDELLTWMVEKQNMPELLPDERDSIVKYLATEFGG